MVCALAEILTFPDIPVKITLNEYIELSKHYSTPSSARFVNGILDRIVQNWRAEGKIVKA
jgi:N utilization substance protein B